MKILKQMLSYTIILVTSVMLLYLSQEFIKEAETYREVDYADVKGCTAEDFDFSNCA